ncbi:MAG: YbaB/EbfC family nucleoid-associated protein [bacterium]|nr:YbaB/EbfC family nucleoid-associated protein [bacterium]
MLGGLGDIAGLMRQAKELKGRMEELQSELATRRYAADAGAGAVTATVDGKGTLVDIRIKPEATADVELLEDLVKAAVGTAVKRAQQEMQAEMSKLTGGINVPGLGNMFGAG